MSSAVSLADNGPCQRSAGGLWTTFGRSPQNGSVHPSRTHLGHRLRIIWAGGADKALDLAWRVPISSTSGLPCQAVYVHASDIPFNPAMTIPEASARMFALTASRDVGTRGPKRSLVALATSLGLDVDLDDVNAVLGGQIARSLDTDWRESRDYVNLQITLAGMNNLLRAAARNLSRISKLASVPSEATAEQVLRAFPAFRPARSKQEAVNRMSDLAGVPRDTLGPGGKEHIWTLQSLARRVAPSALDDDPTKPELARTLARELGVPWIATAGSTGATITREGLNLLLAGAERRASVASAGWATAAREGEALVAALARNLPRGAWEGRASVAWMHKTGSSKWFGSEWAGWFFEEQVRTILNEAYPTPPVGGPRVRYGSTDFDYASPTRVWDAKAHTAWSLDYPLFEGRPRRASRTMWLNDARAMRDCIAEQGLGFLIADGLAGLDVDGSFRRWLVDYGAANGKRPSGYVASTGRSRPRKASWTPLRLRAIWIENTFELDAGIAAGWLTEKGQPAWGAGDSRRRRNPKFQGSPARAARWTVAAHRWPSPLECDLNLFD